MVDIPRAIVLGLGGANPLGVVRSLGQEKIPVVGFHVGARKPHAVYSRYVERAEVLREEELLCALVDFGKTQDDKGVLFPTGDDYLVFCAKNFNVLNDFFHVPLDSESELEELIHKGNNLDLGASAGFSVPNVSLLSDLDSLASIEGKVIVKPTTSVGFGKQDMKVYDDIDSLLKERDSLLQRYGDMSVQEFIPGGSDRLIEIHTYHSSQGPVITGMQRNALAIEKAPSIYLGVIFESMWNESLIDPALRLTENVDVGTPLDINLKQSIDNERHYFLEANFRTSANVILDTVCGWNLPAIIYFDRIGEDFERLTNRPKKSGVKWLHEDRISRYVKHGDNDVLLRMMREGERVNVFYDGDDTEPFLREKFDRQLAAEIHQAI